MNKTRILVYVFVIALLALAIYLNAFDLAKYNGQAEQRREHRRRFK